MIDYLYEYIYVVPTNIFCLQMIKANFYFYNYSTNKSQIYV